MNTNDNDPLHAAIDAKLAQIAIVSPSLPTWHQQWRQLDPESSEEERLAVYKAVREAGSVPADAGFYLVSWQIDAITLHWAEEALSEQEDRLTAIKQTHGLDEDDLWPAGEVPSEYEEAQRQLHDAWDALYASKLDEFGEQEIATLFRTDRQEFERRSEAGREFFHGPRCSEDDQDAEWLHSLLDAVTGCIEVESPMGPMGLRYHEEDGFWEVSIYPTPVELVGGAQDGAVVLPGFSLDLEQLRFAFDSVIALGWNALGLNYPEGPHVNVEGIYQGREVYLQVLAQAPEDEEPGLKVDASPKRP